MSAFVVYPREYVPEEETVYGVDKAGRTWRVVLDVPDSVRSRSRGDVPSVGVFAETGAARNPPAWRTRRTAPMPLPGCCWRSVVRWRRTTGAPRALRVDEQSADGRCGALPVQGVGYMEISAWARGGDLRSLREARDLPADERAREVRRWREKLPYWFTGVVMALGRTVEIGDSRRGVDHPALVDASRRTSAADIGAEHCCASRSVTVWTCATAPCCGRNGSLRRSAARMPTRWWGGSSTARPVMHSLRARATPDW